MHTNMTILLASNSKVLSSILSRSLASIGYASVLVAKDGGEALSLCSSAAVDLLFIDWAMPGVGASEFIERTRTEGAHKETPILIAVLPDAQEQARALCADGLVDTIVKPFSPKALRKAIGGLSPAGEPALPETTETEVHTRLVSLIVESAKKTFETMAFSKLEAADPHLRMGPEGPPAWYSCTSA
jgi:CheY-like chemotaxis protein